MIVERRVQAPPAGHRPLAVARRAHAAARRRARRRRRELGAVGEDLGLELAQLRARLEPQLVAHLPSAVAVGLQRLGLPPAAVEREHELAAYALAQRVLAHERLELADHLRVAAERQVCVDALLDGDQAQLVEPRDLLLGERLVGEVRQRRAAPQRQPLAQPLRRAIRLARGERALAGVHRPLEALHVDIVGAELQQVAVGPRDEHVAVAIGAVLQLLAQLRHVDLQALGRRRRRALAPQLVDQPVGRDDLVAVQEQQREQ